MILFLFCLLLMSLSKETFSVGGLNLDDRCITDESCTSDPWIEPFPKCVDFHCSCSHNACVHYTLNGMGFSRYFCGECGVVGSSCEHDQDCSFPSRECSGGYCMCDSGYLRYDVCIHYQSVTMSMETIFLICTLVGILVVNKIITSWKLFRTLLRKMMSCRSFSICARDDDSDGETVYGYNPESGGKTPAYTISSREFLVTSDDPDLQLALELSILAQEDAFTVEGNDTSSNDNSSDSFSRRTSARHSRNSRRRETPRSFDPQGSIRSGSSSSNPSNILQSYPRESHSEDSSTLSSPFTTPLGSIRLPRDTSEMRSSGYFPLNSNEVILRPRGISTFNESSLESPRETPQHRHYEASGECRRNSQTEFSIASECPPLAESEARQQSSLKSNSELDYSSSNTSHFSFLTTNTSPSASASSSNSLEKRNDKAETLSDMEERCFQRSQDRLK